MSRLSDLAREEYGRLDSAERQAVDEYRTAHPGVSLSSVLLNVIDWERRFGSAGESRCDVMPDGKSEIQPGDFRRALGR